MYLNFNGEILLAEDFTVSYTSRAFQYGDGFFESMRAAYGKLLYADLHTQRLLKTSTYLKLDLDTFTLTTEVEKLLLANQIQHARVKVLFYRESTGTYLPEIHAHRCSYLITCQALPQAHYELDTPGLYALFDHENLKPRVPLSQFKTLSCTSYVLSSMQILELQCDEIILLNTDHNICEGCNANIFFIDQQDRLISIPLQDGRLDGVFAQVVMRTAADIGMEIQIQSVAPSSIQDYKEAFLSNVSRGIRPIQTLDKTIFESSSRSRQLLQAINDRITV